MEFHILVRRHNYIEPGPRCWLTVLHHEPAQSVLKARSINTWSSLLDFTGPHFLRIIQTKYRCYVLRIVTHEVITSVLCIHHYSDVIVSAISSQITGVSIVCSTVYSDADKKKWSSASLAFVRGIHGWPVNSPRKGRVTRKMFPFDDVIIYGVV